MFSGHHITISVRGLGIKSESGFVVDDASLRQVYDLKGVLGVEVGDRMFDVVTNWLDEVSSHPIPEPTEVRKFSWWKRFLLFLVRNSH